MVTRIATRTAESGRAEVAAQLRIVIARAARRLRQQAGRELTPSRASVLATVARDGPLTPSELAERERISRPTITRLVAKLKQQGLVECLPDPADGRSYRVAISAAGTALRADRQARKNAYLTRLLAAADDEELAVLERAAELLERLLAQP